MQIEKRWIIRVGNIDADARNQWIALDGPSGGYPYVTDFWTARKFTDLASAQKYMNTMGREGVVNNWQIYECDEVGVRYCEARDAYEVELAALKLKHGKA